MQDHAPVLVGVTPQWKEADDNKNTIFGSGKGHALSNEAEIKASLSTVRK